MAPNGKQRQKDSPERPFKRPRLSRQAASTEFYGHEEDLTIRHYGQLHEGLQRDPSTPQNDLRTLVTRFQRRRDLARLGFLAEGSEARHAVGDNPPELITILSPLDVVAIRHADGTWSRIARQENIHGAAPYSQEFYQAYLARSGLPEYFLNEEHRVLLRNSDLQANNLDIFGDPEGTRAPAVDETRLTLSAGQELLYPEPELAGMGQPYTIRGRLSDAQRRALRTRFPALHLDSLTHDVIVLPSGHLYLRPARHAAVDGSSGEAENIINQENLSWRTVAPGPASFHEEDPHDHPAGYDALSEDALSKAEDQTVEADATVPPVPKGMDPTNGDKNGRYDQTSTAKKRVYEQITVGGQPIVNDRSRPKLGLTENHLLNVRGLTKWMHFGNVPWMENKVMDFGNAEMVKKLDRWRDQTFSRGLWLRRRQDQRLTYLDEEEDLIMGFVMSLNGQRPGDRSGMQEILDQYNDHVAVQREYDAFYHKFGRMMKELKKYNGRRPVQRRGENKKLEAEAKRAAIEAAIGAQDAESDTAVGEFESEDEEQHGDENEEHRSQDNDADQKANE